MKVASDQPRWIEVDPRQVAVNRLYPSMTGGLEAYGVVELANGHRYNTRIAYQSENGAWQAEGTIRRESPPREIMDQIIALQIRIAQ